MGSFNLDLEARARAVRLGKKEKKSSHEKEMDRAEDTRQRLLERIGTLRAQLIDEIERPETKVARQAEDVTAFKKTTKEVDNLIKMQSLHGRKNARLLVAAHTKMQYERLMQRANAEERFIDQMEHHAGAPSGMSSPLGSPLHSPVQSNSEESPNMTSQRKFLTLLEELFRLLLKSSKKKLSKQAAYRAEVGWGHGGAVPGREIQSFA